MKRTLAWFMTALVTCALPCIAWNPGSYSATVDASRLTGNYDDYMWHVPGGQTLSGSLTVNDGSSMVTSTNCVTNTVITLINAVVGTNIIIVTNTTLTIATNITTAQVPVPLTGVTNATLTIWRQVPPYSVTNALGSNVLLNAVTYGIYRISDASLSVASNVFSWTVASTNLADGFDLIELYGWAGATNYARVLSQGSLLIFDSGHSPVPVYTNNAPTNSWHK